MKRIKSIRQFSTHTHTRCMPTRFLSFLFPKEAKKGFKKQNKFTTRNTLMLFPLIFFPSGTYESPEQTEIGARLKRQSNLLWKIPKINREKCTQNKKHTQRLKTTAHRWLFFVEKCYTRWHRKTKTQKSKWKRKETKKKHTKSEHELKSRRKKMWNAIFCISIYGEWKNRWQHAMLRFNRLDSTEQFAVWISQEAIHRFV